MAASEDWHAATRSNPRSFLLTDEAADEDEAAIDRALKQIRTELGAFFRLRNVDPEA